MSFTIATTTIDLAALRTGLADDHCGACVWFEGWVRDHNEGRAVLRLEYEVYAPLARKEGLKVLTEASARFDIRQALCVHRSGLLELGDIAVVVGVSAAHRDAAFQACRYIIDEIKHRLPIWKREHYADGHSEWVNCQRNGSARPAGQEAPVSGA